MARTETVALGELSGAISAAASNKNLKPRRSWSMDSRLDHRDCYCRSLDEMAVTNYITGSSGVRPEIRRFTGELDMFGNHVYLRASPL